MKTKNKDLILENKIFPWIALAAVILLTIPFMLTIRDGNVKGVGWNWSWPGDYLFGFVMFFGFSSLFVLAARKVRKKSHRIALGIVVAVLFAYIWAEFAVGIFTNLGS